MNERISIADIRHDLALGGAGEGFRVPAEEVDLIVLALVEVAEAAYRAFDAKLSDRYWNEKARDTLARFDFGEVPA